MALMWTFGILTVIGIALLIWTQHELKKSELNGVCHMNCVKLDSQGILGDNPERIFLGKLRLGSIPSLSFGTLVG